MKWITTLRSRFNPQTPTAALPRPGHIPRTAATLRSCLFTQPEAPFSLEAITGKDCATAVEWEALPSSQHPGLWHVQKVTHQTIDGATTLDYGQNHTPRYMPYEEAINTLALMEAAETAKGHGAGEEPAGYYRTHAEQEGFVQNTQGQLVRRDAEGAGGTFTQESLQRAQENAQKELAANGGIFAAVFGGQVAVGSLAAALDVIKNAGTIENGLIRPLQSIAAHVSKGMDSGARVILQKPSTPELLPRHLKQTIKQARYGRSVTCDYARSSSIHQHQYHLTTSEAQPGPHYRADFHNICGSGKVFVIRHEEEVKNNQTPVSTDKKTMQLQEGQPLGYPEDAVRQDINRALHFVAKAPDSLLSPADKQQFTHLVAVAGIDALGRFAQQYFRELAKNPGDDNNLSDRIQALNTDIGKIKNSYLPAVSPAMLAHIETAIMNPEAAAGPMVAARACDALTKWRESVGQGLHQAGQTRLPSVGGAIARLENTADASPAILPFSPAVKGR